MILDLTNPDVVGANTPDPLRFAFSKKRSAHAGGMTRMVAKEEVQTRLNAAYQILPKNPYSSRCLYVHIPFCRVRCTFCNFFQNASSKSLIEQYVDALCEEIRWKSKMAWTQAAPFQAVYFGGGTPTDLSAEQIKQIVTELKKHFPLTPDCEITLEGRINRFSIKAFENALEAGVNRFSFGVQSFDTFVRKKAKRLDDKEVVLKQIETFVSYNAAPIVIDLLFGLPHQTMEVWQQDLNDYLLSNAHGIDLYQLIEMKGMPMESMVEKGTLPMPADTQMKASMFAYGVDFMARHNQRRLSNNHWARNNRERSIYNSLAKTTAEIMPLGAGGGGNLNGLQMMQTRELASYFAAIKEKQHPVPMLLNTSDDHAVVSCLKAGFDSGVLASHEVNKVTGANTFASLMPLFEAWEKNGLVYLNQTPKEEGAHQYLNLTLAGQFWSVTLSQIAIDAMQSQLKKSA